jgi:hypothetical protein
VSVPDTASAPAGCSRCGDRPARRGARRLAVALASELAALDHPTALVDADVYGGVVAQVLGLLDESPGLARPAGWPTPVRSTCRARRARARR